MKKILSFMDQWGGRISFMLLIIVFFKTCTTNNRIEKTENRVNIHLQHIDSTVVRIKEENITREEMVKIIEETPFWKSLELEELSDKNRIPINQLKNQAENK